MLQLSEIDRTHDLPALWQLAINLVSQELSADRIVILLDDGQVDLALAAYRRIDPELLFAGVHVNLAVLKQALNTREVVREGNLQRAVVCCPVLDGDVVRLLVYADRFVDDGLFEHDEVQTLELLGARLVRQWKKLQPLAAADAPISPAPEAQLEAETVPVAEKLAEPEPVEEQHLQDQEPQQAPVEATPEVPKAKVPQEPEVASAVVPASSTPYVDSSPMKEPVPVSLASFGESGASLAKPKPPGSARSRLVAGRYQLGKTVLTCRFSTLIQALDMKQGESMILRRLEMSGDGVRFPESSVKLPVTHGQGDFPPAQGDATAKFSKFREARSQLLREGRFLARLEHRNLPRVYEVLEDQGQVFLVLEDFSGETLEQAESKNSEPLSEFLLLRYFEQLLDVLEYLHHQDPPVIHRDLRPDGILVSHYGVLKLAEFGLAKLRETPGDTGKTSFRAQGSPYFASAEQLLGEPSVPANDFYSLGCILFYLATKQMPPRVLDRFAGIAEWPKLASLRPDLPQGFSDLIELLVEINPEHRCVEFAKLRSSVAAIRNASAAVAAHQQAVAQLDIAEQPTKLHTPPPSLEIDLEEAEEPASTGPVAVAPPEEIPLPPARQSALSKLVEKFTGWNFLLKRSTPVEPSLPPLPLPVPNQEPIAAEVSDQEVVSMSSKVDASVPQVDEVEEVVAVEPPTPEPSSGPEHEPSATNTLPQEVSSLPSEPLALELPPPEIVSVKAGPALLGLTANTLAQFRERILSANPDESGKLILICGPSNRRNANAVESLIEFGRDLGATYSSLDRLELNFRGLSHCSIPQLEGGRARFLEDLVRNGSTLLIDLQATSVGEALVQLVEGGFNRLRLPYLLGFVAMEHLARTLCPHCKAVQPISYAQRQFFLKHAGDLSVSEPPEVLWKSVGCPSCEQTGFLGLQTIYERFELTGLDHKVLQIGSMTDLWEHHVKMSDRSGFLKTVFLKVLEGQIAFEDALPFGGFALGAESQSSSKGRKNR